MKTISWNLKTKMKADKKQREIQEGVKCNCSLKKN